MSDIGLQLHGSVFFPFLKIGTTAAVFQMAGKEPWSKEARKMIVKTGAISLATSLKGGGHGKIYSEFIMQIFSLGGIKTHDTIFKIFGIR